MGSGASKSLCKTGIKEVRLDESITKRFMQLNQHGKVQAEYVWIDSDFWDGQSFDLCCKTLTLPDAPMSLDEIPIWTYSGDDAKDIVIVPRRTYRDPFRPGDNIIVLADTYEEPSGEERDHGRPTKFNTRAACQAAMQESEDIGEDPWFGFEQEYYLLDPSTDWPLGWPKGKYPHKDTAFYCAVGSTKAVARELIEAHYRACLYAGVMIGGINSEVAPAQWEFQVGPASGTQGPDDLWMARYILQRLCEEYHVGVTFDPKPVPKQAGIGCHTNYSNMATRTAPGGMEAIKTQCERLRSAHDKHISNYGIGNERRLTGKDDTAAMSDFSWGIGDRAASIRIGCKVAQRDCGYYEDRRPAANMDPYLVSQLLVETTLLRKESLN
ncbi:unnamed protein product [Effrenium voratum]|uniref:glutamine synthetase n=1 Tax=Effrenium voratum TaxID=2562239 RepID=A0AA36JG81_9DINO|nr:unnamed protein product [Effrenium voratum]CAJ1405647.1 unnamed protein product [Effrenium voratum]CAJ1424582.1 unnamed protein product [Effrenium voratum]|mmetsp:Transcript_30213/g.72054  ORF Transcript_30213/g.72054 Transcript_30213/m.72054 type:complete len:382 (+) Transcript_30213:63-1208(+)